MSKPLLVCFMGQGGYATSAGVRAMAQQACSDGYEGHVFPYTAIQDARALLAEPAPEFGPKAALGYSLGVEDLGLLAVHVDLIIGIDPSLSEIPYPLKKGAATWSLLFANDYWLERVTRVGGAGHPGDPGGTLGFDEVVPINEEHLLADWDPAIRGRVRQELLSLKAGTGRWAKPK